MWSLFLLQNWLLKLFLEIFSANILCCFGFRTLSNCLYLCQIPPQTFWTESVLVPFLLVFTIPPPLLSRTEEDRGTAAAADGNGKKGKWEKKGLKQFSLSLSLPSSVTTTLHCDCSRQHRIYFFPMAQRDFYSPLDKGTFPMLLWTC